MSSFTNHRLLPYFEQINALIPQLIDQAKMVNNIETENIVHELRMRMTEPFLFVIVGEVKAGKSSFVNALLDSKTEICGVAPDPKTDTIQQIKYGEKMEEIVINPYLKQIYHPAEILKEISIVDTPGTNTIVDNHQEITERFVPISDLVVFVFEAKNPYRRSAWAFLDFINEEWKKKVIFILQQKDIMTEADLKINIEGVIKQAKEKNVEDPKVFAVSALQEINDKKEESGFIPLRTYINDNITGDQVLILKIENLITLISTLNNKINTGLEARKAQYENDSQFRKEIQITLDEHVVSTDNQVQVLIDNLLTGYDKATLISERSLKEGLSFMRLIGKSFKSIFNKKESPKVWLEDIRNELESNLKIEMTDRLHDGVNDLADNVQNMAKVVELKILKNKTILKDNHSLFGHIAEKRRLVIDELKTSFQKFIKDTDNFGDRDLISHGQAISPSIATGSGIAVIGIILTAVTNGAVFDVTGGLITTVGLLFAGITTGIKRNKILKQFNAEITSSRQRIKQEITDKLTEYIGNIRLKIDEQFIDFDQLLETERKEIEMMTNNYQQIDHNLQSISSNIKKQKN
ncbi:dynamin family protein [Membranihabitans marinus]|uniref:dynamin family protein n=1 Tax=Membranihabitans marinus TaxID=1227546 RepID=UPI001F2C1F46|nr:dynamin family protein [Membranihabitans marinus]